MSRPFTFAHYEKMLTTALDAGYAFGFYEQRRQLLQSPYGCILRHDCDYDLVPARELAGIESSLGIHSTWFFMLHSELYNLMSGQTRTIVEAIVAGGHRVALHFSTDYYPDDGNAALCDRIDAERALLYRLFGQEITTVSFHQPTPAILENRVKIRCVNTYDRDDMAGYHYISDSNMIWREACATVLLHERRHPHLQLLLHPEWWTETEQPIEQKYETIVRNGFEQAQAVLLDTDRTYNAPRRLVLLPPGQS